MAKGFGVNRTKTPCPCGSGEVYDLCCAPLHQGAQRAVTAEQLMRSRYTAYALSKVDYLIATHPTPHLSDQQRRKDLRSNCRQTRWLGLRIVSVEGGDAMHLEGIVRFEAIFSVAGKRSVLRETSQFERRGGVPDGDWLYVKGLSEVS